MPGAGCDLWAPPLGAAGPVRLATDLGRRPMTPAVLVNGALLGLLIAMTLLLVMCIYAVIAAPPQTAPPAEPPAPNPADWPPALTLPAPAPAVAPAVSPRQASSGPRRRPVAASILVIAGLAIAVTG